MKKPLLLASASPRRSELLRSIGIACDVAPTAADEPECGTLPPAEHALTAARAKARAAAGLHPGRLVLAADTVVAVSPAAPDVLGKPRDAREAAAMLRRLSGRTHRVLTAVVLASDAREASQVAATDVEFRELPESLVARYVASGEPSDKAGAYAVQGLIATHLERIAGSWTNVVGLPLEALPGLFAELGLELADWQDW